MSAMSMVDAQPKGQANLLSAIHIQAAIQLPNNSCKVELSSQQRSKGSLYCSDSPYAFDFCGEHVKKTGMADKC